MRLPRWMRKIGSKLHLVDEVDTLASWIAPLFTPMLKRRENHALRLADAEQKEEEAMMLVRNIVRSPGRQGGDATNVQQFLVDLNRLNSTRRRKVLLGLGMVWLSAKDGVLEKVTTQIKEKVYDKQGRLTKEVFEDRPDRSENKAMFQTYIVNLVEGTSEAAFRELEGFVEEPELNLVISFARRIQTSIPWRQIGDAIETFATSVARKGRKTIKWGVIFWFGFLFFAIAIAIVGIIAI